MQTHTLVALAAQGFRGTDGLSLATSIAQRGIAYQVGQEYFTFFYATDHISSDSKEEPKFAFASIEVEATTESEYYWVTMEQWHKIAEIHGREVSQILALSLPEATALIYDYLGAEAVFATPQRCCQLEE